MKTVDNSFKPPIEKCLGYWYEGMQNRAELTALCRVGSNPPLQCMFDQPMSCKGRMLIELTRSSSTFITDIERRLLWYAAFGQELVCKGNESRIVKAGFLQWLLTNPEAVKLISTNGIRAKGIIIKGNLNLENVTINFPVVLEESYFQDSINLTDTKTFFLSLKDSICNSTIEARRIMVKGNFLLYNFRAKKGIDIRGANISGDLDCRKGRFINKGDKAFWAGHIQVDGNLFLTDSYVKGEVNLSGAKIGGNLDCINGKFTNSEIDNPSSPNEIHALDTSLAEVGGEVCFNSFEVTGHVLALEMKIGGDFDCTGGSIKHEEGNCHAISIDRSSIGGSVGC